MWVKSLSDCTEIVANDLCRLRELVHPDHDGVEIGYSLALARIDSATISGGTYKKGRPRWGG